MILNSVLHNYAMPIYPILTQNNVHFGPVLQTALTMIT